MAKKKRTKTKAAKKVSKKKKASPTSKSDAAKQATVRMFCQGLGDCFLITLPQAGKRPYSILIDCGVAKGTPNQTTIMERVVAEIAELTAYPRPKAGAKQGAKGKKSIIDLLIVTHEHLDHVSGFSQAQDIFESRIEFRHIWFAWTENRRDKLAQELRASYSKAKLALANVRARLAAGNGNSDVTKVRLDHLDGIMAFSDLDASGAAAAASKKGDLERGMENLRSWACDLNEDGMQFLKPPQCMPLPGADASTTASGVWAYVMGPPHDRAKITRINPSKKNPEVYEKKRHLAAVAGVNWSWSAAAMQALDGDSTSAQDEDYDRSQPFDRQWRIPWKEATEWTTSAGEQFFEKHYFAKGDENDGRRVDDDWLWSGAQKLALHIESYTNNTSLVIAFELPRSKKVLLFAADAQVGNWLSWHDQPYTCSDGKSCTAEELLGRTVLYKVGHHGSHNATLRQLGLELMNHPELTALIPVEVEAVERLGYGEMPLISLSKALDERCQGRVLQLDKITTSSNFSGDWKNSPVVSQDTLTVGKKGGKRPIFVECIISD
jgi:hypothetical protein